MRVVVEPDYFQFYARRHGAEWASDKVPRAGYAARLWTDGGFVYLGTRRKFGPTPVDVTVHGTPLGDPGPLAQHVAEVSLLTGRDLEIYHWGSDEPALTVELPSADVRLRVSWQGLGAGQFEGMDDEGNSDEHLAFDLWAAPSEPPRVLRHWSGWPPLE